MSKKHHLSPERGNELAASHTAEYRIIQHDLLKVVILNAIYLAVILALYYANRQSHFLEHWLNKFIHI